MHPAREGHRPSRAGGPRGCDFGGKASGARNGAAKGMSNRLSIAVLFGLIAMGGARLAAAGPGSVTGVVRDSAGTPQMGAEVELLGANLSLIATVYTNASGRYRIPVAMPGRYAIKAMGTSFLPSLRENVRVRSNTIVNLTLNTLYEVMQWLPAEPRSDSARQDDWAWTLRSAANRPLLRWLEDGPLVVVRDGPSAEPRLKARLLASGEQGSFGESGERISMAVEDTPSKSRELLARVEFAPGTNAGIESMLGFRQDLGFSGSVQTVAAYTLEPEVGDGGVMEAALRSMESIRLGDEFEAEAGTDQVIAHSRGAAAQTAVEVLPFLSVGWMGGDRKTEVSYRMSTSLAPAVSKDETRPKGWLPALAARDGRLTLEHGLHQEIEWQRQGEGSDLSLTVFSDRLENPVVEAMTSGADSTLADGALTDAAAGLLRAAGPAYSSLGFSAAFEHRLGNGSLIRLSYANGDALVMPASAQAERGTISRATRGMRPRRAQMYALALSGTLEGTGTRWRASSRWQPEETLNLVAPFSADAAEPYLSVHLRQPLRTRGEGGAGIDALLDVRNLLGEGYQPYLLSDGSLLIFAQQQRAIRAGLAFTF